jgi:hypothetical protein
LSLKVQAESGAEPEDLIRAVRVAARGEALLAPSVTRRLIETFASRGPAAALNTGRGTGLGAGPRNGAAGRNGESPPGPAAIFPGLPSASAKCCR